MRGGKEREEVGEEEGRRRERIPSAQTHVETVVGTEDVPR